MDPLPNNPAPDLGWSHVGIGFSFIVVNTAISHVLHLHVGTSLAIAAIRCVMQLTAMATILQSVFATKNLWAVVGIAVVLNVLGTLETVVIKASRRCQNMFAGVLVAMMASTIPVSILGVKFAMRVVPFWTPEQFIPVMGMLCGNAIATIMVSQSYVLKELDENRDKTETLLAFGASRFEACRPLAVDALRLALMPIVNQMSVIGIISIPGMMTGAILGGANVEQAARLQMIIMFMISASSGLSCIAATLFTLYECVDSEHRIRGDRIYTRPHALHRFTSETVRAVVGTVWAIVDSVRRTWDLAVKRMLREKVVVVGSNGASGPGIYSPSERSRLLP